MIEPLAFFGAVMVCIWMFPGRRTLPIVVLAIWVLASWIVHRETAVSLGLSLPGIARCFIRWRLIFLALFLLVLATGGRNLASTTTLWHALRYLAWCIVQQAVYQSMVFQKLRSAIGQETVAAILSGILFSLVHLPNPLLVPATFVWGVCASLLFCACRSVIALGGVQFLLSAIGVAVFPVTLHHAFRIGPGY